MRVFLKDKQSNCRYQTSPPVRAQLTDFVVEQNLVGMMTVTLVVTCSIAAP